MEGGVPVALQQAAGVQPRSQIDKGLNVSDRLGELRRIGQAQVQGDHLGVDEVAAT
jgi:hypothetical protein